jgi:hypothetical protein
MNTEMLHEALINSYLFNENKDIVLDIFRNISYRAKSQISLHLPLMSF